MKNELILTDSTFEETVSIKASDKGIMIESPDTTLIFDLPEVKNLYQFLSDFISAAEFISLNTEPEPANELEFKVGDMVITKVLKDLPHTTFTLPRFNVKKGEITDTYPNAKLFEVHGHWWPASDLEHVKEQKPDLSGKGYSQFANKEPGANPFKTDFGKNPLTTDQVFTAPESPVMIPLDEVIKIISEPNNPPFVQSLWIKDLINKLERDREHYAQQPQLTLDYLNDSNTEILALKNKIVWLEKDLAIYKDLRKHH